MIRGVPLDAKTVSDIVVSSRFRAWVRTVHRSGDACCGVAVVAADLVDGGAVVCLLGLEVAPPILTARQVRALEAAAGARDPTTPEEMQDFRGLGWRDETTAYVTGDDDLFRHEVVLRSATAADNFDLLFLLPVLEDNLARCLAPHLHAVPVDIGQGDEVLYASVHLLCRPRRLPSPRRGRVPSLQALSAARLSTNDRAVYDRFVTRPSRSGGGGGGARRASAGRGRRLSRSGGPTRRRRRA